MFAKNSNVLQQTLLARLWKKTWTGFYTVGENAKWHNFHGYLAIDSKITYALDYESILMFK